LCVVKCLARILSHTIYVVRIYSSVNEVCYTPGMDSHITYTSINSPSELDVLIGNSTSFDGTTYDFSSEYLINLKENFDSPNAIHIMATNELGEFVGYIAGSERTFSNYLFLSDLFVSPEYDNFRIGTELLDRFIDQAKAQSTDGIIVEFLEDNTSAQKLYEHSGFKQTKNPDWEGLTYQLVL
jgi:ribosomal protein S18 acetylase RimI-like enzyme